MADNGMRLLERRWKETGDIVDFHRYVGTLARASGRWNLPHEDYPHLAFGTSSAELLNFPAAWKYASVEGGVLQSLAEAVIRRVLRYRENQSCGRDLDHSDKYQVTRTVNLKFYEGGKPFSAFAELPDHPASLELLTRGFQMHSGEETGEFQELLMPYDHQLIGSLLDQARISKRIRPVRGSFDLPVGQESSAYGSDADVIALFGSEHAAQLNSSYLHQNEYSRDHVWDFDRNQVAERLGDKKDHVLVRPVGLGGVVYVGVYAYDRFDGNGRACPVAHNGAKNFSTGNKGSSYVGNIPPTYLTDG